MEPANPAFTRRVLDLSMPIVADRPIYPDEEPAHLRVTHTYQRDGYRLERLDISTHEGAHIDAPAHMLEGGANIDELPVSRFIGPGAIFDLREVGACEAIGRQHLRRTGPRALGGAICILFTGWGGLPINRAWVYDAPWLSDEGAEYLADGGAIGVGIDHISLSTMTPEHDWAPHKLLARRGIWLLEGLTLPDDLLEPGPWLIVALPLALQGTGGAPARVVAIESPS